MYMVRASFCFYDLDLFLFTQLSQNLTNILFDLSIYCQSAIFWGKDHLVLTSLRCMD